MPDPGFLPVARQSVSDTVFAQLRDAVVDGRYAPGDSLPPERELAQSFAVNRHAVREALKRLQEAGFVQVVHGGGTQVLDVRRSAGLDLLAHLARSPGEPAARLVRDGLEMRRCVGIEAARLAARRADDDGRRRILDAAERFTALTPHLRVEEVDRAFWNEVVDASDNLAFRLALNSLLHAIDGGQADVMALLLEADRTDALPHGDLARAIAAGDEERAVELAAAILTQAVTALEVLERAQRPGRSA